ncbi:MAG: AAA family ATPase, partial [Polyangiaceae bacterium]|nr:AAA family ATPase [Polyangiaceae bacterium]
MSVSVPAPLLFGRSAELAAARAHLASGERLLVLRGPPGVGKSTLARALGSAVARDGWQVHVVALGVSAARAELLGVVAAALGVPARTDDARVLLERLASHLEGERTLLVVDGVEEQAAAVRELILDLLGVTSDLSVVACSQRPLGASLEVVVSLGPLAMDDAVALLTRRAWQLAPDRPITAADAERLAARAGRLPLALELVAAWVATLGTSEALGAIDEGHLEVDALDRALDASWNLLPEEERS